VYRDHIQLVDSCWSYGVLSCNSMSTKDTSEKGWHSPVLVTLFPPSCVDLLMVPFDDGMAHTT
jgi:hypothetical protein